VHVAAAWALISTAGMVWALLVMVDSGVEQELHAVNADLVQERSAAGDLRDQLTRLAVELENSRIDQEILYTITAGLQDELRAGGVLVKVGRVREPADAPIVFRAEDTSTADTGKTVVPLSAQSPATANPSPYLVKKGDTLWSIARKHGLSVQQLSSWNRLTAETAIQVGQQLQVSALVDGGGAVSVGTDRRNASHYTVKPGDSLYGISRQFNVSVADLQQWNRLDSGEIIIAEQQLIVLR
jgi:LysM repeat protein